MILGRPFPPRRTGKAGLAEPKLPRRMAMDEIGLMKSLRCGISLPRLSSSLRDKNQSCLKPGLKRPGLELLHFPQPRRGRGMKPRVAALGLPWEGKRMWRTLQGLCPSILEPQPLPGLDALTHPPPKVGAERQPWAGGRCPVGALHFRFQI